MSAGQGTHEMPIRSGLRLEENQPNSRNKRRLALSAVRASSVPNLRESAAAEFGPELQLVPPSALRPPPCHGDAGWTREAGRIPAIPHGRLLHHLTAKRPILFVNSPYAAYACNCRLHQRLQQSKVQVCSAHQRIASRYPMPHEEQRRRRSDVPWSRVHQSPECSATVSYGLRLRRKTQLREVEAAVVGDLSRFFGTHHFKHHPLNVPRTHAAIVHSSVDTTCGALCSSCSGQARSESTSTARTCLQSQPLHWQSVAAPRPCM